MIRLPQRSPPTDAARQLEAWQAEIDAIADFDARVTTALDRFRSISTPLNSSLLGSRPLNLPRLKPLRFGGGASLRMDDITFRATYEPSSIAVTPSLRALAVWHAAAICRGVSGDLA